jgi:aspartyl-tRNA(Asn)/glutamyl-tRNA(Gln) amidotransferase subunit A
MSPLLELAAALNAGRLTARALIEQCLERIADPAGQGSVTFLKVFDTQARAAAEAIDGLRRAQHPLPHFAGIPLSVKDLFDTAGEVTTAGSTVLRDAAPARRDAVVVRRLRAAGFIVIGRTNMTEFAYSGVGLNPHYGTPLNPFDRRTRRIPGGSSSGAAIAVTDGMAAASIGTDTGGSCRIPAAMTGVVGFKPTAARIPRAGVMPLSTTLDSVGPLAPSVSCCAILDAVLSGAGLDDEVRLPEPWPLRGLRLLVPQSYVLENLDASVAEVFERSLAVLSRAGASLTRAPLPELEQLPQIHAKGGFSAAESYATYRELLDTRAAALDPRVAVRMLKGREQSAADYLQLQRARAELIGRVGALTAPYDASILPTVATIAPPISELDGEAGYFRANALALRNPAVANFLDRCAISIPAHHRGEAPVGIMLMGEHAQDAKLFAIARAVEAALAAQRGLS